MNKYLALLLLVVVFACNSEARWRPRPRPPGPQPTDAPTLAPTTEEPETEAPTELPPTEEPGTRTIRQQVLDMIQEGVDYNGSVLGLYNTCWWATYSQILCIKLWRRCRKLLRRI